MSVGQLVGRVADTSAVATAVVLQAMRPTTWRRPVRAEFLRVLDDSLGGCLMLVLVAAVLVGLGLVAQALYWEGRLGDEVDIRRIVMQLLIREIAVPLTAFLIIGRAGLRLLAELSALNRSGVVQMLDRQGVDPFLMLVVPRVLAIPVALFCLSVVFVLGAFTMGFFAAGALEVVTGGGLAFASRALHAIGEFGAAMLPLKSLAVGFAIGLALCLTGLSPASAAPDLARTMSAGFVRMLLAALLVNVLMSVML